MQARARFSRPGTEFSRPLSRTDARRVSPRTIAPMPGTIRPAVSTTTNPHHHKAPHPPHATHTNGQPEHGPEPRTPVDRERTRPARPQGARAIGLAIPARVKTRPILYFTASFETGTGRCAAPEVSRNRKPPVGRHCCCGVTPGVHSLSSRSESSVRLVRDRRP